jgi:tetratricopeptide (TPR) repeat protein
MRGKWSAVVLTLLAMGATSCSKDPETAKREYLAQGDRYLAEKKYPEAIVQYRNALGQDPKFGDARLRLTDAYIATGDVRNALRESVRAADVLPDSVDAQVRAGSLLLYARQYPEARARAVAALAKDSKNPRALVLLGNALAGLKDVDGAIEQVEQAIDEDPQLMLSYANLGSLYTAKGDRAAAEAAFKRAVEASPRSVLAHLSLANFQWSVGARAEAERELKIALEIEPRSTTANRALATFYISQNRASEAEPYFETYADLSGTVESRLLLSDYYVGRRKISEATGVLSALTKEKGGFVPATLRLAVLDFGARRRPEAYRRLEEILKQQPKNERTLETKARFLLFEGKNQEALSLATALVTANPKSTTSQYLRGVALEATGSIDEATGAFKAVLQGAPSAVPAQVKLANLYLRQGDAKGALDLAQQVVKAQPQSGTAHFLYAQALLKSGDLPNAERELVALAKAIPSSADVHTWLGMLYEAKKDLGRARQSYRKALDLEPKATIPVAGLAAADLAEKKPAVALGRIESRLAESPNDIRVVGMAAMAYAAVRDWPKAESAYRKMLELDPNAIEAYGRLGAVYLSQNRLDEARRSFEDMARHQAKPVAAETMLGTILTRQNKPEEARKHFERALAINPRAAVAANNLAWDYSNNGGNLDVALQLAQTAKAALPEDASVADTLGWVYYKKGLASLAVTALREAVQQNPSNPGFHYHLGLAYLQGGNKVDAKATLQHVLKLNPKFQAADDVRRVLATIQG